MIKKYRQFLIENQFIDVQKDIRSIISEDEVEDQFLRIREVFGWPVYVIEKDNIIRPKPQNYKISLIITEWEVRVYQPDNLDTNKMSDVPSMPSDKEVEKINNELNQIKSRIESTYPLLSISKQWVSVSIDDIHGYRHCAIKINMK